MSFTQKLLIVKTESIWQKKRKINKLTKVIFKKQLWGCKSGITVSLQPSRYKTYITPGIMRLTHYPLNIQQFNYFIFYKHLLKAFRCVRTEYKNLTLRCEHGLSLIHI